MLLLKEVTKSFRKKEILHKVNLKIEKGIVGLLGPNGAGKTTLLRLLATVYEPTTGDIELNGISWAARAEEARNRLGYLPQHVGLFPSLTSYEYLDYIALLRNITDATKRRKQIEQVLNEVNMEEKKNTKIRQLSGGMKQRLGIAQAIVHEPELLLVDEPTAGLDPEERLRFRSLLRRLAQHRIVILSTHITDDISMTCDQVCMMKLGNLHYFPSLSEVVNLASNKVWEVQIPKDEYTRNLEIQSLQIINSFESDDTVRLRILSAEKPDSSAVSVNPGLEEGYMTWLKEL